MARPRYLRALEAEAIHVLREVAAQFARPVLLFSGGKDSAVLAHLAAKAFRPGRPPWGWLHVDTGHNFPETLAYRDALAADLQADLHIARVADDLEAGRASEPPGPNPSRNRLQTVTLARALAELGADAAIGGARRDEERSRAKERVFSHRDQYGQWDPRRQRPELWRLYNGGHLPGEHLRVFPLSNWTELDVWRYVEAEHVALPPLYFAHEREVFPRGGTLLAHLAPNRAAPEEPVRVARVRFRTVGDVTCTGATPSEATTVEGVLAELGESRVTERAGRADDRVGPAAMESRKRQGYF